MGVNQGQFIDVSKNGLDQDLNEDKMS